MSGDPELLAVKITQATKVGWFDLRYLLATAAHALAAGIVGSMTGRREIMAALSPAKARLPKDEVGADGAFWFDYMADCGDGWNACHSVAWLLGRDGIALDPDGAPTAQPVPVSNDTEGLPDLPGTLLLPAGSLLVLGGDEVYPSASADNYDERFTSVMRSARNWQEPGRSVYAIPGNHDWYDGLTSFIRLFCQTGKDSRWFGAWNSRQQRSYFAIPLPHGWWLWGVDMALDDDLDPPQLAYFRAAAAKLTEKDRVILCVPTPSWLKHCEDDELRNSKLQIIIDIANGAKERFDRVPLILSGDLHYYARHQAEYDKTKREYITCGGGGAFTLGTTRTPTAARQPAPSGRFVAAKLEASYPDRTASTALRTGVLKFPLINPGFSALLAAMLMMMLWLLTAFNRGIEHCGSGPGWLRHAMCTEVSFAGLWELLGDAAVRSVTWPELTITMIAVLSGFAFYGRSGTAPEHSSMRGLVAGALHGLAQLICGLATIWLVARGVAQLGLSGSPAIWMISLIGALLLVPVSGFLFGTYLYLSHCIAKMHDMEVYSAQALDRFKSFLRIRIDAEKLTIFSVGLTEPVRNWRPAPGISKPKRKRLVPSGSVVNRLSIPEKISRIFDPVVPLAPHLIEAPIEILRN